MTMPLLIVDKIVKDFPKDRVVNQASIEVKKSQIVVLYGKKGAGKRSIINIISGLLTHDSGTIIFNGIDISRSSFKHRTKLGLASPNLRSNLFRKVIDIIRPPSIEEILYRESTRFSQRLNRKLEPKERLEICDKALNQLMIEGSRRRKINDISYGIFKRFTIALCLVREPQLIIIDAPFEGLNMVLKNYISILFQKIFMELNISILFTVDEGEYLPHIWDYMYYIESGKIISEGNLEKIRLDKLNIHFASEDIDVSFTDAVMNNQSTSITSGYKNKKSLKRFRIALSFSGEHRIYVEQVANILAKSLGRQSVFYDKYYIAELARPDLDIYLQNIYHNESDLVVFFISSHYEKKEWCGLEWRSIRDLIKKKDSSLIMPIRFDDTHIDGLFSIDGYIEANKVAPNDLAILILNRLKIVEGNNNN